MCLDTGSSSGDQMRQQEEERQQRINEGTNAISQVFGGDTYAMLPNPEYHAPGEVSAPASPPPSTGWAQYGGQPDARADHGQAPTGPFTSLYNPNIPKTLWQKSGETEGQFGPDFFNNLEQNYRDYYMPQFARQAQDAERATRLRLSRSGNIGGSVGVRDFGRLAEDTESERRRLIDESIKYSSGQKKSMEDTRANLIGQLESGAGIDNVAGQASAAASAMTAPPAFSPLGDLFKNYTAALANSTTASGSAQFPGAEEYRRQLLFNIPSAGGSGSSYQVG